MNTKCAYCGKTIRITAAGWGYAYGGLYTCSYGCMRAMEREANMTEEQKRAAEAMLAEGKTTAEIAEKLTISRSQVGGYISAKQRIRKAKANAEADPAEAEEIRSGQPVSDEVRTAVVKLIQDMLDVIRKLYGV